MRRSVKTVCDAVYGVGNENADQELYLCTCGVKIMLFELGSLAALRIAVKLVGLLFTRCAFRPREFAIGCFLVARNRERPQWCGLRDGSPLRFELPVQMLSDRRLEWQ